MSAPEKELAVAMAKLSGPVAPEVARGLQATENLWRQVEKDWGLLTSRQVAELLIGGSNTVVASRLRTAGKIIGFRRNGQFRYPGFQFDRDSRRVRPVVAALIALGDELGYDPESVILSLASPSTYWADDTPLNHIDDEDFLHVLKARWTAAW